MKTQYIINDLNESIDKLTQLRDSLVKEQAKTDPLDLPSNDAVRRAAHGNEAMGEDKYQENDTSVPEDNKSTPE